MVLSTSLTTVESPLQPGTKKNNNKMFHHFGYNLKMNTFFLGLLKEIKNKLP